jgi:hypothetical protein
MEPEGPLPFSQKPATGSYPVSDKSSPQFPPPIVWAVRKNLSLSKAIKGVTVNINV